MGNFYYEKTQPYEHLKKLRYYSKTLTDIKIEKISLKLGGEVASLEDITSKSKPIEDFVFKTGKDLSMLYCKTDRCFKQMSCKKLIPTLLKHMTQFFCFCPFTWVYLLG